MWNSEAKGRQYRNEGCVGAASAGHTAGPCTARRVINTVAESLCIFYSLINMLSALV
jgi:hypothetical protein